MRTVANEIKEIVFGLDFWQVGLILCVLFFVYLMHHLHKSEDTEFQFEHLFMDDHTNRASSKRVIAFGAFLFTSWIIVRQEATSRLTAEIFGLYVGAWVFNYVAPVVMERFGKSAPAAVPPTKTEGQNGNP